MISPDYDNISRLAHIDSLLQMASRLTAENADLSAALAVTRASQAHLSSQLLLARDQIAKLAAELVMERTPPAVAPQPPVDIPVPEKHELVL